MASNKDMPVLNEDEAVCYVCTSCGDEVMVAFFVCEMCYDRRTDSDYSPSSSCSMVQPALPTSAHLVVLGEKGENQAVLPPIGGVERRRRTYSSLANTQQAVGEDAEITMQDRPAELASSFLLHPRQSPVSSGVCSDADHQALIVPPVREVVGRKRVHALDLRDALRAFAPEEDGGPRKKRVGENEAFLPSIGGDERRHCIYSSLANTQQIIGADAEFTTQERPAELASSMVLHLRQPPVCSEADQQALIVPPVREGDSRKRAFALDPEEYEDPNKKIRKVLEETELNQLRDLCASLQRELSAEREKNFRWRALSYFGDIVAAIPVFVSGLLNTNWSHVRREMEGEKASSQAREKRVKEELEKRWEEVWHQRVEMKIFNEFHFGFYHWLSLKKLGFKRNSAVHALQLPEEEPGNGAIAAVIAVGRALLADPRVLTLFSALQRDVLTAILDKVESSLDFRKTIRYLRHRSKDAAL